MTEADIQAKMQGVDIALKGYVDLISERVSFAQNTLEGDCLILKEEIHFQVAIRETEITGAVNLVYFSAYYNYLGVFVPLSPSIATILAVIWKICLFVWDVVKTILEIMEILQIATIHDIMMTVWPAYREMVNMIFRKVSELSSILGWGVDGLGHLLNAVQGGINVYGGVTKKSDAWMEMYSVNRAITATGVVGDKIHEFEHDPGAVLDNLFSRYALAEKHSIEGWWVDSAAWITRTASMATIAFDNLGTMADELLAIKNGMPEAVRKYIPQALWDGLEKVNTYIYDNILPRLSTISQALDRINERLAVAQDKAAELVDRLARPGTLLLGVDALPEYARLVEEHSIDMVTSREFQRSADAERDAISGDLDEFDRIDNILSVAPAPLPFMTLESPERKALTGIIKEPRETWFVGDF